MCRDRIGGQLLTDKDDEANHAREEREALLVEYGAAQDSAQHHDGLVWSITSILWGSSLILLGLVVSAMHQSGLRIALTCAAVIAIALTSFLWLCARQLRAVKVQKYRRCIELERQLGMKQHSTLRYSAGVQTKLYAVVMALFLAVWCVVIVLVWV